MSQINTNVPSMIAQRVLRAQNQALNTSLERLGTGLRINRGKDDPAGLIASENLRSEKTALGAAIKNAQRAEQVINVAEGGLQEISTLIIELQGLVGQSANEAGLTADEKNANHLQVDAILQTIDRIANSTSFQGTKLLNGDFDYTTSGVAASVNQVQVNSALLGDASGANVAVTVEMVTSGQTAEVYLSTGATLTNADAGAITIEISGSRGVQQFTFASGTSQANIISAINSFSESLGVSAIQNATDTSRVEIRSLAFGESSFVRAKELEGATTGGAGSVIFSVNTGGTGVEDLRDEGRDATVLINGSQASSDGVSARVTTTGLDIEVEIDGIGALNVDGATETFYITGGGANFNLAPKVNLAGRASLGIGTVTTGNLGSVSNGFLSALRSGGSSNVVDGDLTTGQSIIEDAINYVTSLRGRLGAFQRTTIGSTMNNLGIALENTSAAESAIRDTDFASETAALTRSQILSQAATQTLLIAKAQPQAVLALLG